MADELNPQASMQSLQALADELALRSEAQEGRCIDLSELSEAAQAAELSDDDVQLLQELLQDRGLMVRDDCGRRQVYQTTYVNGELAQQTVDAMSLFLQEVRRHPLLTREQEVEVARRIEQGDLEAKEQMVNSNLRLVIDNARKYQGQQLPLLDMVEDVLFEEM